MVRTAQRYGGGVRLKRRSGEREAEIWERLLAMLLKVEKRRGGGGGSKIRSGVRSRETERQRERDEVAVFEAKREETKTEW